ncbi:hypothetical protein [Micromonospora sp. NPDC023956]|uniref:hypothetical protein n=1 Tax=Micromonospora sp. NPDC023956 TaxID=3155722 RepID=UPI0033FA5468
MTVEDVRQDALVRGKLMAPGLPSIVVERPRVDAIFTSLFEEHRVVGASAVTGSGKTVQAQLIARRLRWPLVWLTLDPRDRSASRMLSWLAEALEPAAPGARRVVEEGFARRLPPEETAALLAEEVSADRALVVIDQCEVLVDDAAAEASLASFLDHLPGGVHAILLGRTEHAGSAGRLFAYGRLGRVSQEDLALTEDEATALARAQGHDPANAAERCRRTNGWMAAVAFVGSGRRSRAAGSRDFFAILGAEILGGLTGAERRFLLDTAVLGRISPRAATELCGPEAGSVLRAVRLRHLPATTMADGTVVLHSCFRDFLRNRLAADEPDRLADLQRRHADLLVAAGEFEEATELLLSVGDTDVATGVVEKAVPAVLGRGDGNTVLRWLESLAPEPASASPVLLGAKIRALVDASRLEEARALVREVDLADRLTEVLAADPGTVGYAAGATPPLARDRGRDVRPRPPASDGRASGRR